MWVGICVVVNSEIGGGVIFLGSKVVNFATIFGNVVVFIGGTVGDVEVS